MAVDQIEIRLSAGAQSPRALPLAVIRALTGMEISVADTGRSGFRLSFLPELDEAGDDYTLLSQAGLAPSNRLVVEVLIDNTATVLIDGVITHRTLTLGAEESRITLMGEDVSVLMDPAEKGAALAALYVGPGAARNIDEITFEQEARTVGKADSDEGVGVFASALGALAKTPALRQTRPLRRQLDRVGGLTLAQAIAKAQAEVNRADLDVATARGRLVVNDYGALLIPRRTVVVDGAGRTFDGDWCVRSVVTRLEGRSLVQAFELSKEGSDIR